MSMNEILAQVALKKITPEQAAELLNQVNQVPLRCKVSEKGAVSVYGLQRMPVTLYGEQWKRLIAFAPEITKFVEQNAKSLSTKADRKVA